MIELQRLERALRNYIDERMSNLFTWTLTVSSGGIGQLLGVDTGETADDDADGGKKRQTPMTRIEPWGFRGSPAAGIRSLQIRWGRSKVFRIGVEVSQGYGAQDLAPGESEQYSSGGSSVRCDTDGNVNINRGSKGVARVDDSISISGAELTALQLNLDARYAQVGSPAGLGSVGGKIAAGSSTVKAGD